MIWSPHAPRWRAWTRAQTIWIAAAVAVIALLPVRRAPHLAARDDAHDARPPGSMLLYGEAVDVERATAADFAALPGIGPAKARAVVEARERDGGFCDVDEVRRAARLSARTWERVAPLILLRPAPRCSASSRG